MDGSTAVALCKNAHLLPAALVVPVTPAVAAAEAARDGLTLLHLDTVRLDAAPRMVEAAAARVPLHVSEAGRVHVLSLIHI